MLVLSLFFFNFYSFWDPSPGMVVLTCSTGLPTHDSLSTLREEKNCLAYSFRSQPITEESQGKDSIRNHGGVLVMTLLRGSLSASFLMLHRPTYVGIYIFLYI